MHTQGEETSHENQSVNEELFLVSAEQTLLPTVTDGESKNGPDNAVLREDETEIMLLSDPEIESSILISNDEGATYQKYRLNFYIQSLLFHPKQEDWILAYSIDQKADLSVQHSAELWTVCEKQTRELKTSQNRFVTVPQ
ncbi:VPS10 domain-containing receptor SorCS1 [Varanus komodoensis]|nr:VPS10 domain-containing receptor SorCS1 [Varanus komodoensis]